MCNLSAGVEEKGRLDAYLASIKCLMEEMSISAEKAMAVLRIPEEEGLAKGRVEGRAEGITDTYLASIKSLMEEMSMSAEKAMSVPEVPEAERHKYLEMLEQKA